MPFVQYVASLAVLEAVQDQARHRLRERGIDMRIKWPNDLYIGGLKVHRWPHEHLRLSWSCAVCVMLLYDGCGCIVPYLHWQQLVLMLAMLFGSSAPFYANALFRGGNASSQAGGVLCQSTYRDKRFRVVVGVGLNLSNRQPTTCVDAAIEDERSRLQVEPDVAGPIEPEVRPVCSVDRACLSFRGWTLRIHTSSCLDLPSLRSLQALHEARQQLEATRDACKTCAVVLLNAQPSAAASCAGAACRHHHEDGEHAKGFGRRGLWSAPAGIHGQLAALRTACESSEVILLFVLDFVRGDGCNGHYYTCAEAHSDDMLFRRSSCKRGSQSQSRTCRSQSRALRRTGS